MTDGPRTGAERKVDSVRLLEAVGADTWVATASSSGVAHLVPLSYAWDGRDVLIAAPAASLTVRNIRTSGRARLAFGATRDVLIRDPYVFVRLRPIRIQAWREADELAGRTIMRDGEWLF